jgi:hypothetical protein
MKQLISLLVAVTVLVALAGCATTRLTVDDGRKLDDKLVSDMKAYGAGAAALRPAIVRSAALEDKECSSQYELPFEAMTSYGVDAVEAKIAMMRALGVNEKLTVIAADPSAGVARGDVITEVAGYKSRNSLRMIDALADARDRGAPFRIAIAPGRKVMITPVKVCRGYATIASPLEAAAQNYHWTKSVHPLQVFHQPLTADEAAWIVLWTQGLSEQSGAAMKTYAFLMGSVRWLARIALAMATSGATAAAKDAAAALGSSAAGQVAAVQIAGQAASLIASAAANRASLTGINGIAAGRFEQADQWAFANMRKLGMNPRAGISLHEKLLAQRAAANAFLLDDRRLAAMRQLIAGLPGEASQVEQIADNELEVFRVVITPGPSRDNRSVAELDVRGATTK